MFRLVAVALAILALTLTGCVAQPPLVDAPSGQLEGSGNPVTQEFDYENFTAVNVGNSCKLEITPGDAYSVSVTIDDNLVEYLVVEEERRSLRISLQPDQRYSNVTFEAKIVMPDLQSVSLEGASQGAVSGFQELESPILVVAGASKLTGDLQATNLNVTAEGASTVQLSGSADNVSVTASGASTVDLAEVAAGYGVVEAEGASEVTVQVNGQLDAQSLGASQVYYLGDTTLGMISESEGGTIEAK